MVAYIIWDDGAQFESDIFYFAQFSNVGSSPVAPTVAVAELVMHWIVAPDYVGFKPHISHR